MVSNTGICKKFFFVYMGTDVFAAYVMASVDMVCRGVLPCGFYNHPGVFLFLPQSGRNALLCMMQSTLMWFVDTGKNTATARVSVGATMKSCVLCHAKQESKQNVRCKFVAPS